MSKLVAQSETLTRGEDEAVGIASTIASPAHPLSRIEIDGYRPFREFEAEPGGLTVIIGANGSGKSSLFDFLRFIGRAVTDPLPPEIDERAAGRALFHVPGPERIRFGLTLDPRRNLRQGRAVV